jgi:hypothetical protein
MLVFVEDSAEAVFSAYVEVGDLCRGERFGDGTQGCCLMHRLVRPVEVVVQLELAECVAQVVLVPVEGVVQEFVAAGLDPAFNDGVHVRYPDAGEDDPDADVAQ